MATTTIGSVLVDLFEAQAAIGLALLLIVIYSIVHGLLVERRGNRHGHDGSHR